MTGEKLLDTLTLAEIEHLREDLVATKATYEKVGWSPETMYRNDGSFETYRRGSMCMTGAAGLTGEGQGFIQWMQATANYGSPSGYQFKDRTSLLLIYLAETGVTIWPNRSKGYSYVNAVPVTSSSWRSIGYRRDLAVEQIIEINDNSVDNEQDAINWVVVALTLLDAKLEEIDPPKPIKLEVLPEEWMDRLFESDEEKVSQVVT